MRITKTVVIREINKVVQIPQEDLTAHEPEADTLVTRGAARVPRGRHEPTNTDSLIRMCVFMSIYIQSYFLEGLRAWWNVQTSERLRIVNMRTKNRNQSLIIFMFCIFFSVCEFYMVYDYPFLKTGINYTVFSSATH